MTSNRLYALSARPRPGTFGRWPNPRTSGWRIEVFVGRRWLLLWDHFPTEDDAQTARLRLLSYDGLTEVFRKYRIRDNREVRHAK